MVTLTQDAIVLIDRYLADSKPMDWFLFVSWKRGDADNRRTSDGDVTWEKAPDVGWVVDFGGYNPGKVPSDAGTKIYRDVRLLIQNPTLAPEQFPGGEVYVEAGTLKLRTHAI